MTFERWKAAYYRAGGSVYVDEIDLRLWQEGGHKPSAAAHLSRTILSHEFDAFVERVRSRHLAELADAIESPPAARRARRARAAVKGGRS